MIYIAQNDLDKYCQENLQHSILLLLDAIHLENPKVTLPPTQETIEKCKNNRFPTIQIILEYCGLLAHAKQTSPCGLKLEIPYCVEVSFNTINHLTILLDKSLEYNMENTVINSILRIIITQFSCLKYSNVEPSGLGFTTNSLLSNYKNTLSIVATISELIESSDYLVSDNAAEALSLGVTVLLPKVEEKLEFILKIFDSNKSEHLVLVLNILSNMSLYREIQCLIQLFVREFNWRNEVLEFLRRLFEICVDKLKNNIIGGEHIFYNASVSILESFQEQILLAINSEEICTDLEQKIALENLTVLYFKLLISAVSNSFDKIDVDKLYSSTTHFNLDFED
jgi:hypothetical protein